VCVFPFLAEEVFISNFESARLASLLFRMDEVGVDVAESQMLFFDIVSHCLQHSSQWNRLLSNAGPT